MWTGDCGTLYGKHQEKSPSLFKLGVTTPSLALCTRAPPATAETDVVKSIWKPREAQLWPVNALDPGHRIAASPDHTVPATFKPERQERGATTSATQGPRGRPPCLDPKVKGAETRVWSLYNFQQLDLTQEQCYLEDMKPGPRQLTAWARLATISAGGQQSRCQHKGTSFVALWGPRLLCGIF